MNSELYKTTIESFGVSKPSKILTSEARKIAMGKPGDMKLIKKEIALCKLTEKTSVTAKQQERINKLAADIDNYINKKNQPKKIPQGRQAPINPRQLNNPKLGLTQSKEVSKQESEI